MYFDRIQTSSILVYSVKPRRAAFDKKRDLSKETDDKLYIKELLTRKGQGLWQEGRKALKDGKVGKVWSWQGIVYVGNKDEKLGRRVMEKDQILKPASNPKAKPDKPKVNKTKTPEDANKPKKKNPPENGAPEADESKKADAAEGEAPKPAEENDMETGEESEKEDDNKKDGETSGNESNDGTNGDDEKSAASSEEDDNISIIERMDKDIVDDQVTLTKAQLQSFLTEAMNAGKRRSERLVRRGLFKDLGSDDSSTPAPRRQKKKADLDVDSEEDTLIDMVNETLDRTGKMPFKVADMMKNKPTTAKYDDPDSPLADITIEQLRQAKGDRMYRKRNQNKSKKPTKKTGK